MKRNYVAHMPEIIALLVLLLAVYLVRPVSLDLNWAPAVVASAAHSERPPAAPQPAAVPLAPVAHGAAAPILTVLVEPAPAPIPAPGLP